jgi:hypothetical protein
MSESWIDRCWKDVLKENLDDAIAFFMPGLAELRDYSQEPQAADPDRPAIGGKSSKGNRMPDLCISLPLKSGGDSRAIFMIEQQHEYDYMLPLRIFQSYYRAIDEYAIPVTLLAIYTGKTKPVNTYAKEWQGTSVCFKYNVYSVYNANVDELTRDARVFSLPILAAKKMLDARGKAQKRGEYSLELLERIRERNFDDEKASSFQRFVYHLFQIYKDDIAPKIKEVWKMKFRPISELVREIHIREAREEGWAEGSTEGMKKGMEKGMEKGKFDVARTMLADGLPAETVRKYTGLDESSIRSLR